MRGLRRASAVLLTGLVAAVLPTLPAVGGTVLTQEVYPRPSDGVYKIAGHGWGHGVGMSQNGAIGAATQGLNATQILAFYYPGTTLADTGDPVIKVALRSDTDSDLVLLDNAGDLTAVDHSGAAGNSTRLLKPDGSRAAQWGVLRDAGGLRLRWRDGTGACVVGDPTLDRNCWHSLPGGLAGRDGVAGPVRLTSASGLVTVALPGGVTRTYPGDAVAVQEGSALVSTVQVKREDYVRGVLPKEISTSAPAAAQQAQAVAARTYGAWRQANPRSTWVDVRDNTDDQVYDGTSYFAGSDAAVAATAGRILTWKGLAAFTQFSSSNGGWSRAGSAPYLPAQADPYDGVTGSSVHSWTAVLPVSSLEARYPALGRLVSMTITSRDGNGEWGGRVLDVVLRGTDTAGRATTVTTNGSGIYAAYTWPTYRTAGSSGLRSYWFTVTGTPPSAPTAVTATALDGAVRVGWGAPSSTGTEPVNGYVVTTSPGGRSVEVAASARTVDVTGLDDGTAYTASVVARSAAGVSPAAVSPAVTPQWTWGDFVPRTPQRLYDTREGPGRFAPGETRTVTVAGTHGVPANATAVALTATATNGDAVSYLTIAPTGWPRPVASALNWTPGRTHANAVVARLGTGGRLDVRNDAGRVDVVLDVVGWWTASAPGSRLTAVTPVRTLDTRESGDAPDAQGVVTGRVGTVAPATAVGALLNVTAVVPSSDTYLSVRPAGAPATGTSTLNPSRGAVRAAATVMPLGTARDVVTYNDRGRTEVLVDALGWFTPAGGASGGAGQVAAVTPTRLLDTRDTASPLVPKGRRTVAVTGRANVPAGVKAVLLNVTAVGADGGTYLRIDDGRAGAEHSNLNVTGPEAVPNLVLVPVAANGTVTVYSDSATVHVLLDLVAVVR